VLKKNAQLHQIDASYQQEPEHLKDLPEYQQRNWHLAHEVFSAIKARDLIMEISEPGLQQAMHIQVPGRMDQKEFSNKTIVMDGAHNGQKMHAFVSSFKRRYPGKKVPVLLSLKTGKDYQEVLPLLEGITTKLILTTFAGSQDTKVTSITPDELAQAATQFSFEEVITEPDQDKAYENLLNEPGELCIITGSFYLIGQLRQNHKELM